MEIVKQLPKDLQKNILYYTLCSPHKQSLHLLTFQTPILVHIKYIIHFSI